MEKYFYTVELCEDCARRLELLAACAGYDDVERFAAMAISLGLHVLEEDHRRSIAAVLERRDSQPIESSEVTRDLDDEFPF